MRSTPHHAWWRRYVRARRLGPAGCEPRNAATARACRTRRQLRGQLQTQVRPFGASLQRSEYKTRATRARSRFAALSSVLPHETRNPTRLDWGTEIPVHAQPLSVFRDHAGSYAAVTAR